jgi:hypothetical protein
MMPTPTAWTTPALALSQRPQYTNERINPIMQPLGFFTGYDPIASTPTALHLLDKKFGSYLQRINRCEKLALLAIISHCLAANAILILKTSFLP